MAKQLSEVTVQAIRGAIIYLYDATFVSRAPVLVGAVWIGAIREIVKRSAGQVSRLRGVFACH
jgi:hypothetical protein